MLGKTVTPRVKWGQNKEQLFISVIVRDLELSTVSVQVSESDLSFWAKSTAGDENVLQIPLRDDVKQDSLKWEIAARPDKWGTTTMITLGKGHAHRWDVLTSDTKKFKGLIDKDWTREDQTLEPAEEMSLFDDAESVLRLNEKNFNKTVAAHPCLVVSARFPWCSDCKSADQTFLKASSAAKVRSKKRKEWKKVRFGFLDARENKRLARKLHVSCSYSCEYLIFSGSAEEEPARIKSQFEDAKLLDDIERFLSPAVMEFASPEEAAKSKASNATAIGYFSSKDQKEFLSYRGVANRMRGELLFAATFGQQRDHIELWTEYSAEPFTLKFADFSANNSILETWLRQRSVPLLQEYEWSKTDMYERLKLPLARVWYDDKNSSEAFLAKVNATVKAVAKKLLGRMAFVKQKKSTYAYELRDYGLAHPEEFPAFGVAENVSWNSRKFGLDLTSLASAKDFWSDAVLSESKLMDFCESVLAGTIKESHESGPLHSNWTKGEVKRIVWRSFDEIKTPKTNLLLEIYGKYRVGHEAKLKEVENLAAVLEPFSEVLTVASYDTAENHLPREEFDRDKYASHTEWYWIPVSGSPAKLVKPKRDAPMKKVLNFVSSQAPELQLSVTDLMVKWEAAMKENPPPEPAKAGALGDVNFDDLPPATEVLTGEEQMEESKKDEF